MSGFGRVERNLQGDPGQQTLQVILIRNTGQDIENLKEDLLRRVFGVLRVLENLETEVINKTLNPPEEIQEVLPGGMVLVGLKEVAHTKAFCHCYRRPLPFFTRKCICVHVAMLTDGWDPACALVPATINAQVPPRARWDRLS